MKYFGTDGFRGEANVTLNVEHAYKVGRFLGNYFQKEDHKVRVVIGKDTRLSGYMFETALASGLTASGADVYELHVTTTPSVSYLVRKENFDCGIMISASHNPYFDNGIKVINGKGHKLEPEIEEQIEKYIDGESEEIPMAKREAIGRCFDYTKGRDEYIEYLKDLVKEPFDGKTVALDLANGSASMIAKEIFESMGAQVIARHDEPNGTNINRECGSTHIEVLQALVYDTGADIGFAYDGDADRCLAVDDDGVLGGGHVAAELTVHGVVLQHIGQVIGRTQIVDAHDLDFRVVNGPADHHTADAAKTVDSNFNTHFKSSPSRWNISNIWYVLYYTLFS